MAMGWVSGGRRRETPTGGRSGKGRVRLKNEGETPGRGVVCFLKDWHVRCPIPLVKEMPVVEKEWGREEWVWNGAFCGKILRVKKGKRCSLHCHPGKDEAFYLLEGAVKVELEGKVFCPMPGEAVRVAPGQRHRFTGLTDAVLIEFSTHHDDDDVVRIEPSGDAPHAGTDAG